MKVKQKKLTKCIQTFLGLAVIASFIFFIVAQLSLPAENKLGSQEKELYDGEWVHILEDGSKETVQLPVQLSCKQGQWAVLETHLPDDIGHTCLVLRSLQQDFKIYVDGKLRREYSTIDTQLFGKTSTITYIMVPVDREDGGKVMRIEFMSDSFYSGYMEEILCGEKSDVVAYLVGQFGASTLMAIVLFLVGLAVMIACQPFVSVFRFKGSEEMFMMGILVSMISAWLLSESKLRQFFFPNSTIAMYMGFFMIMLLPYSFLGYINFVQKKRYETVYSWIWLWSAINFVACTLLQVLDIRDFFETMTSSHLVLGAVILAVFVTIIRDIITKAIMEYRIVAFGLAGILLAAIFEISLSYVVNARLNGVALCVSLLIFVCAAAVKVGRELTTIEREKHVAEEARRAQALFLANMSHEIRTPINTVLGMNEMILRQSEDKEISGYAKDIKRAGKMLVGLIDEILDFSKIEAGKLEIGSDEYSLSTILTDAQTAVLSRADEKGLTLSMQTQKELPAVLKGDELRMKQILNNLLSNAVKYTESGSVTLGADGEVCGENSIMLRLWVEDTGMGIKKEDIPHLFDSFQRLELERNRHIQGTGLGLCITKQLVDAMGGTIKVSSEYGEGTRFEVCIPQEIISWEETQQACVPVKEEETEVLCAPDAEILAVDDNRVNLAVLKGLLKRTQVHLDLAMSGKQALELTREKKYDLILMDHMMPEMDGIETLAALRAEKDNPNCETKVIALTANAIQGAEQEYRKEGFDDYLSKPVDPEKLEKMLKNYL